MTTLVDEISTVGSLQELHPKLDRLQFGPGWNKSSPSLWPEPKKIFQPAHWEYAAAKIALDAAGRLISTELAERRNLILVNPYPGNTYATAATLVSAYQMIMPGEYARSHRHTPNALRLIVDSGPGVFTTVNDEKLPMMPGDVVLTPNWFWHGHSNEGKQNGYWIDFLDVPLVQLLGPIFFEPTHPAEEPVMASSETSPLLFPWRDTERKLADASPDAQGRWAGAVTLDSPDLENLSLQMLKLAPDRKNRSFKTTANIIYAVVQGQGVTSVEGKRFEWKRGDVFVVPTWYLHDHQAYEPSVLFKVSDEPIMSRLGLCREYVSA